MKRVVFIVIALFISVAIPVQAKQSVVDTPLQTPLKSPNDKRKYGYFVLPNRMRVLLVSDPEANEAAAAMNVGVGTSSEPNDRPGLAHFLEHMLFMGTKKYPGVEDYGRFISDNGGQTNAFTASNRTTYFFSVKPDKLEPALDRFAQFFIAPLFDKDYVEREKHAVNSEYQLKLKDDTRRIDAATKQGYNPRSPYARFGVGNLATLADRPGDKVRDDLLAFYRKHYSANIMGLVIIGRESLTDLRRLAEEKFSAVVDRDARRYRPTNDELMMPFYLLPSEVDVVPLKDMHQLSIVFPLPSPKADYPVLPLYYLSNLIGDEGEGSLYAALHDKGWVTMLSAGGYANDDVQGQFQIGMELTPEGMQHREEIQKALFDTIGLLKSDGVSAWRYKEQQQLAALDFRFAEKQPPFNYAPALAGRLLDYPMHDVLRGGRVLERYDAATIRKYLGYLRPDYSFKVVVDKQLKTNKMEPYYQVPYAVQQPPFEYPKQPPRFVAVDKLHLPAPNPFVPEHPQLKPVAKARPVPQALERREGLAIWHQQDDSFGVPRATVEVKLETPLASDTAEHAVEMTLLTRLVEDELNALTYPAQLAGLTFDLSPTRDGLEISVYGYDEKLPVLFDKVLAVLRRPKLAQDRFAVQKARLRRELENRRHDRAYLQVFRALARKLVRPSWSPEQRLAALQHTSRTTLADYAGKLFDTVEVSLLAHGNLTEDEARQLARRLQNGLLAKARLSDIPDPKVTAINPGNVLDVPYPVDHPDSVVVEADLGNQADPAAHARWKLLAQLIKQPFYTQLRTEQQLGYVVQAQAIDLETHPGLLFLAQSSKVSVDELKKRIATFQKDFLPTLEKLSDADFDSNKAGLITTLMQKDETLGARSQRYFDDLNNKRFSFAFKKRVAAEVAKLKRGDIIDFYRNHVLNGYRRAVAWSAGTRFGGGESD